MLLLAILLLAACWLEGGKRSKLSRELCLMERLAELMLPLNQIHCNSG
jgi:hypothetical protein